MSRRLALAFVLLALAGCSGSSDDGTALGAPPHYRVPGCEAYDTAACDVRDASCQERLMQLAACLRQEPPAELPPVSVMTEAEVVQLFRVAAAGDDTADDPAFENHAFEKAYALFGLVVPGALDDDAVIDATVPIIGGFYRIEENDIVIVDHGEETDPELASDVLVHEFIHVLQDREVELATWGDDYPGTFDASLALRAVVEGEARFHEIRYRAPMLGVDPRRVDWQRTFQNRVDSAESWVLEQDSPLVAASNILPYEWGARLADFDWDRNGHTGAIERFANPPETTHAWMASIDGIVPDDFTPTTFELPAADGWAPVGTDVLGAVGLFLVLSDRTPDDRAHELALAWRGDLFAIYQGAPGAAGAGTTAAVWSLDFADEASAAEAGAYFPLSERFTHVVSGSRLTVVVSDGPENLDWALPPGPE